LICGASDFFFLTKTKLYMKAFQIYFIVKTILNSNKKVYTYNQIKTNNKIVKIKRQL